MELSKYITSQSVEVLRSSLHPAAYNPREISEEGKRSLKRIIKKYGLVGGIVANQRTGNTIVSGHQRLSVMDELQKYDPITKENDYRLRIDLIDVDERTERELNIAMNNPNAQGSWDRDKLAQMIPDIDYKGAGLTEADLSILGLDYLFQTPAETQMADELSSLMSEVEEEHQQTIAAKKAEREERAAQVAHMKEVKAQVKEQSGQAAEEMDAYLMLSFDNITHKTQFLQRFGYDPDSRFIKGEDFDQRCEVITEE